MPDPRQGRAGVGGFSPRLGARDPRLRANASSHVSDQDIDGVTLERDDGGRTRIKAADGLRPVNAAKVTLAELAAAHNALLASLRSRSK